MLQPVETRMLMYSCDVSLPGQHICHVGWFQGKRESEISGTGRGAGVGGGRIASSLQCPNDSCDSTPVVAF